MYYNIIDDCMNDREKYKKKKKLYKLIPLQLPKLFSLRSK